MRIGIVIEPYEEKNTSGISYAIMSQAKELLRIDAKNEYLLYTHVPVRPGRFEGNFRNVLVPKSFFGKNAWFLRASLFRKKDIPDVLLFNMPLLPLVLQSRIRILPIFYELSAYQKPGAGSFKNNMRARFSRLFEREAVKRAHSIVTASHGGREDIVGYFKCNPEKVSVLPLGFQTFVKSETESSNYAGVRDHFLFVGRVKYKKNVHNIVDGFIAFRKKNPHARNKLYIVGLGGGRYNESVMERARQEGLEDEVVFTGFVSDSDMHHLYTNARALVFCSLQEGFGMPILEAMDFGVPVITSNRAPMNEVGGEAAVLVDPENIVEIARAMEALAFNEEERTRRIELGRAHAKHFSWNTHAHALLALITRAAQ